MPAARAARPDQAARARAHRHRPDARPQSVRGRHTGVRQPRAALRLSKLRVPRRHGRRGGRRGG